MLLWFLFRTIIGLACLLSIMCVQYSSSTEIITVPLEGVFYWKLVFDYDNSNNAGSITQTYRYRTIEKFRRSTFLEKTQESLHQTQNATLGLNINTTYSFFSANVDYRYEEINDFFSTTVRAQVDASLENFSEIERRYEIGPHSKLALYQRYFVAPGITYACDAHSTTQGPDERVRIDVTMKRLEFVSNIKVVYGNSEFEKPDDCLKDVQGGSSDINAGYGGNYVWLVPEWSTTVKDACTGFDVVIKDAGDPNSPPDLAKGAGGHFRFLVPVRDSRNGEKVVAIALLRSTPNYGSFEQSVGYNRISHDLNRHRGGDFLHVVYKVLPPNAI